MITPCIHCNEIHKGATLHHAHEDREGIGYVRLLVVRGPEFCWRCGCQKSGWTNVPNDIAVSCPNPDCICHTAVRAH
jgi:hypothetical protein